MTLLDDPPPSTTFDDRGRRLFLAKDASGRLVNEALVRAGLARALPEGESAALLAAAQAEASSARRGCLWGGPSGAPPGATQLRGPEPARSNEILYANGFTHDVLAAGLASPTAFVSLPDGRIWSPRRPGSCAC